MSVDVYCKLRTVPLQEAVKYCEIIEKEGDFWLKTPQGGTLLTDAKSESDHITQLTGYFGGTSDDRWDIVVKILGEDNILSEEDMEAMIYDHSLAEGTIWKFPSEEEIEAYKKEHPEMFEAPQEFNDTLEECEIDFSNL